MTHLARDRARTRRRSVARRLATYAVCGLPLERPRRASKTLVAAQRLLGYTSGVVWLTIALVAGYATSAPPPLPANPHYAHASVIAKYTIEDFTNLYRP